MVAHYEAYRAQNASPLPLLLIGQLNMPLPQVKGVKYLGYLPDEEKRAAVAGASVVICPSPYESLSIVMLEALAAGVPALVNGRSEVLRDHCVRSNGGLYYDDGEEFTAVISCCSAIAACAKPEEAGQRTCELPLEAVMEKYRRLIRAVSS
jgi:glycosyltransferase involved in cell wall biosynthesis